jgi:hypothetical protein
MLHRFMRTSCKNQEFSMPGHSEGATSECIFVGSVPLFLKNVFCSEITLEISHKYRGLFETNLSLRN